MAVKKLSAVAIEDLFIGHKCLEYKKKTLILLFAWFYVPKKRGYNLLAGRTTQASRTISLNFFMTSL